MAGRASGKVPFWAAWVPLHAHTAGRQQGHPAGGDERAEHRLAPTAAAHGETDPRQGGQSQAHRHDDPQPRVRRDAAEQGQLQQGGRRPARPPRRPDRPGRPAAPSPRRYPPARRPQGPAATRSSCGRCLRRRRTRRRSTAAQPPNSDQRADLAVEPAAPQPRRPHRRARRPPATGASHITWSPMPLLNSRPMPGVPPNWSSDRPCRRPPAEPTGPGAAAGPPPPPGRSRRR